MAICFDPPIITNPMIDGVENIEYFRPFISITEVRNWEVNNPYLSDTKTYKIGYEIGKNTKLDIDSQVRLLRSKATNIKGVQVIAFKYGLMNGRTVQELYKEPINLG